MTSLARLNPVGRFDGRADIYARYRPSYPAAAIDRIVSYAGLAAETLLVDVGAGTGISARLFAERGIPVIGIEPNDQMRAQAEAAELPTGLPRPRFQPGRAEATGLPDGCAAAVLAAQSFHWFETEAAFREFHRILRPRGTVALMWNERDESDPCTAAYGKVIRTAKEAAVIEGPRGHAGEPLLTNPLFQEGTQEMFASEQRLDEDGLLGRAFSASYAPREPAAAEAFAAALRAVFAAFQREGLATLRYRTALFLARRR